FGRDWQNVVYQADVLCVVGKQLDYFFGYGRFPHLSSLIQVDVEASEIGRNRVPVSVGMVADAKPALAALAAAVPDLDTSTWVARLRGQADELANAKAELARSDAQPIHPMRLCAEVAARIDDDTTLVGDASNMLMWVDASFRAMRPGRIPSMGNLGTIGHGVCYPIAGALARPRAHPVWVGGGRSVGCQRLGGA